MEWVYIRSALNRIQYLTTLSPPSEPVGQGPFLESESSYPLHLDHRLIPKEGHLTTFVTFDKQTDVPVISTLMWAQDLAALKCLCRRCEKMKSDMCTGFNWSMIHDIQTNLSLSLNTHTTHLLLLHVAVIPEHGKAEASWSQAKCLPQPGFDLTSIWVEITWPKINTTFFKWAIFLIDHMFDFTFSPCLMFSVVWIPPPLHAFLKPQRTPTLLILFLH